MNIARILSRFSQRLRGSSGGVYQEFILVVPLLLFVGAYTLRFAHTLQAHEIAVTLSREFATKVFNECSDFTVLDFNQTFPMVDRVKTADAIQMCLEKTATLYQNSLFPPSEPPLLPKSYISNPPSLSIVLEVFRYDLGSLATGENCPSAAASTAKVSCTVGQSGLPSCSSGTGDPKTMPSGTAIPKQEMCQRNRVAHASVEFQISLLDSFLSLLGFAETVTGKTIKDETFI